MLITLRAYQTNALQALEKATTLAEVDLVQREYLGKAGHLENVLRRMSAVPSDLRKEVGYTCNDVIHIITQKITERKEQLTVEPIPHQEVL